nr:hypothetical protein Iba_chr01cCG6230 [Ipomoea batatas]
MVCKNCSQKTGDQTTNGSICQAVPAHYQRLRDNFARLLQWLYEELLSFANSSKTFFRGSCSLFFLPLKDGTSAKTSSVDSG